MPRQEETSPPRLWKAALYRAGIFSLLWWVLLEGAGGGLPVAALFVAAATVLSLILWPAREWAFHPAEVLTFIPWFLWNSLLAGIDVSWRAYHPRMPLNPGVIKIDLNGSEQQAVVFSWTVSLIPGTACIELTPHRATLHLIDRHRRYQKKLDQLLLRIDKLCVATPQRARSSAKTITNRVPMDRKL